MFNKHDPSICDLACFGELTSIVGTGFNLEKRWPSIHKWYFKSMCGIPEFMEVHNKGIEKVKKLISVRKSKGLPTYEEESKVDEGPNTNAGQAKKFSIILIIFELIILSSILLLSIHIFEKKIN